MNENVNLNMWNAKLRTVMYNIKYKLITSNNDLARLKCLKVSILKKIEVL